MSTVHASSNNNPFAYLQYLQQQSMSVSGSGQSDLPDSLLATLEQETGANSAASATVASGGATGSSGNSAPQLGPQTLQALFAMQANASNSNSLGSSTTTITYADGSSVTMTSAATADGSSSSESPSSWAGTANVANNNLLEQLIQIQAQLLNPTATQSVAMA
jgi:hypothetical protein